MPPTRRIPKLCRHKATGQAVVRIDGRDYYLGKYGTHEAEQQYRRLIAKWLTGSEHEERPSSLTPTVNELLLQFWVHAEQHYRKRGRPTRELSNYKRALSYVRKLYGNIEAADLSPLCLKAVRQAMVDDTKRGRPRYTRKTVNDHIIRIRHVFKWGVENELVPASTYHALIAVAGLQAGRTAARESAERRPVPDAAVQVVKAAVNDEIADLIELQRLTGARSGELLRETLADPSPLTTAAIDRSNAIWTARIEAHKTEHFGKGRRLFFGPRAQLILRRYLKANLTAPLFTITVSGYRRAVTRGCDRAFPPPKPLARGKDENGKDETNRAWEARLTAAQKRELREWRKAHRWCPHQLRHTAATAIRDEFGAEAAQVILGHARLATTELYAQKSVRLAAEVMERIG